MASDRSQFNQALRKWDKLSEADALSVPVDDGDVAILWSGKADEAVAFEAEANDIGNQLELSGIESEILPDFTLNDAYEALVDPTFSSMIIIGNGNLSEAYDRDGESFDWRFISRYSAHLKTGRFTMRHCGQSIRNLSVPLGTFAMNDHSNVFAAHNETLPTVMTEADDSMIQQLHSHRRLAYHAVKNLFIQQDILKDSED